MSIIIELLNNLLSSIYLLIGDWGITIVIATVIVRLIMLPISIKQKRSMKKQQELSSEIKEIKSKYNNDKQKLEIELNKLYAESAKSTFGCLITLIQLPIMYSLYKVFSLIPIEVGSIIVPWVVNIKLPDVYFIIPLVSAFVQLMPNILMMTGIFKSISNNKSSLGHMIIIGVINIMFLSKAPVTIGIYWITSGILTLVEQFIFSLRQGKKQHKLA